MYATDIISVTDLREKLPSVVKKLHKTFRPLPVLAHNQVQFYIMSNEEYEQYQKLLNIQQMKKEVKETKKKGKYFDSAKDAMSFLED